LHCINLLYSSHMKKNKKEQKKRKTDGNKLLRKAGVAIQNEFYLEASWILSILIEKKLKKVLGKIENHRPGAGYSLEQSVKRVKYLHLSGRHPQFSGNFDLRLIDEIRNWKNQRNIILKDMQDVHVSQARMERLALEGIRLLKEWNRAAKKFRTARVADGA
jgi:hypothetical protein